jgi:predicted transcriptional regulator
MDQIHIRPESRLSMAERAMIESAYSPDIIELIHFSSIPRNHEKGVELLAPDVDYNVGLLISGWVLTESDFRPERVFSDLVLPADPLFHPPMREGAAVQRWHARTEVRVFWMKYRDLLSLFSQSASFRSKVGSKYLEMRTQSEERLRIATHYGASSRIAYFILETLGRLKSANAAIYDRFLCPLSQTELGSLLGMTNIHVSRSLARLEDAELIKRHKSFIEVVDEAGLRRLYTPTRGDGSP